MTSPGNNEPPLHVDAAVSPGENAGGALESFGITCRLCQQTVADEYFDVNGQQVCAGCRDVVVRESAPSRGAAPFIRAGVLGLGAMIAGAILYYAVIATTDLEVGLVAVAIGYLVGYAILKGVRGNGGRRFQILAVVLTYWAVGLAYVPLAVPGAVPQRRHSGQPAGEEASVAAMPDEQFASANPGNNATGGGELGLIALAAYLMGLSLALPILSVVNSLPGGLINAAIIGFGMYQAWRMTAAPHIAVAGPFRVGSSA